ncbi:MAG: hypothetical protein GY851_11065, partial [bacterium]|nr:hypothetical protein [bacterium]
QSWWEDSLGSPDTRQNRIDQAAGTTTLVLDTSLDAARAGAGFVIDPTTTFALTNPQHMANPQTFQSDPAAVNYTWEVGDFAYASTEDLDSTLTYQTTVVAGAWTYTETFTSNYDIRVRSANRVFFVFHTGVKIGPSQTRRCCRGIP